MNQMNQLELRRPLRHPPLRPVALAERKIQAAKIAGIPQVLSDWAPALAARQDPTEAYRWTSIENMLAAGEAFLAAAAAHKHGLDRQVRLHLGKFLDQYHEDMVFGHIVPAVKRHLDFPQAGVLKDDFRPGDGAKHTFMNGNYRLLVEHIDIYGRAIPLSALSVLDEVESLGIPLSPFWVATPTWVKNDPILAGQISHYLVGIAYWL